MIKRRDITTLLEQGEISDSTFELLNDRISQYVDELGHGSVLSSDSDSQEDDITEHSRTGAPIK